MKEQGVHSTPVHMDSVRVWILGMLLAPMLPAAIAGCFGFLLQRRKLRQRGRDE
jgi:hypothetical protein